ncbi:SDR family NAD(P)-dependent oxidoreductase [Actinomadura roseirufa]|uniref:SDR family NAD(P)-dependent oxidoreductase n=1 Tax=Actinomadura roseirufa TaxID=2094049 RepID=UPI0010414761|nr:SDR family oxidoreductase [Actinomadura roseirufa]
MRGLTGKNVLITGGTSGIGAAAARRFLEEGARVFVCGLDGVGEVVAELSPLGEIAGTRCDVSREDDVARLVAEARAALGGLDVLINNAGTSWREPFLEITPAHWDTIISVNLRGMFLVGQAVSKVMVDTGTRGSIVNMASTNALGGEEDYAHYNASKGGVLLLTKTMAVELGRHGIRVNAVCPGYIRTPLNASIEATLDPDFVAAYQRDHIPLGRAGQAAEVASAYAFLASDEASFVHGAELVIDGGQLAIM